MLVDGRVPMETPFSMEALPWRAIHGDPPIDGHGWKSMAITRKKIKKDNYLKVLGLYETHTVHLVHNIDYCIQRMYKNFSIKNKTIQTAINDFEDDLKKYINTSFIDKPIARKDLYNIDF